MAVGGAAETPASLQRTGRFVIGLQGSQDNEHSLPRHFGNGRRRNSRSFFPYAIYTATLIATVFDNIAYWDGTFRRGIFTIGEVSRNAENSLDEG